MKIAVVGAGVVGLTTGAGFAELGHSVICMDIDSGKISGLRQGIVPYFEPGLRELVIRNVSHGRLSFGTEMRELPPDTELVVIAVGTPSDERGDISLSYFWEAAESMETSFAGNGGSFIVAVKSTVPAGTADRLETRLRERLTCTDCRVHVASLPEFMREGSAVSDFFQPARIVIGVSDAESAERLKRLHAGLPGSVLVMDRRSAELAKLAANAFLAVKISFANEVAALCEGTGADYVDVSRVLGTDERIGPHFLGAGIGFGGSCLPKDTRALVRTGEKLGAPQTLVETAIRTNLMQTSRLVHKLEQELGNLGGRKVALLGLAFKAGTGDMREAPSLRLAEELLRRFPGIMLTAYDPVAGSAARRIMPEEVLICGSAEEALSGADAAIVAAEWPEFGRIRADDFKKWMNRPIIWDGRNILDAAELNAQGVECIGTGRPAAGSAERIRLQDHSEPQV